MEKSNKNQYYQFIRGMAIIFVILIHCMPGMNYPKESFSFNFWMIERNFMGIAVPLFFAMSGYFTKYDKKKVIDLRLIIPFVIWSAVYGVLAWVRAGATIFSVRGIMRLITGQNASHLYFIFVLIQIRLILPFLEKFKEEKWLKWLIVSMTTVWFGLYYIFFVFKLSSWPLPFGLSDFFPAWLLYWYIGFMMRQKNIAGNISSITLIILTVISFFMSIGEGYILTALNVGVNPTSQLKITNLLYCICAVFLMFKMEKQVEKRNIVTYIGDYSYGIYYVHYIFIYIIAKYENYALSMPIIAVHAIELFLVCGVSLAVLKIFRMILGKKISSRFLGV